MEKKILFVINPIAGTQNKMEFVKELHQKLRNKNMLYDIAYTKFAGEGKILAKKAIENHYDAVVAVGGDGTVNEIASALVNSETALGIIPFGSGNGLARHWHIEGDYENLISIISTFKTQKTDVGLVNNHYFFATAGIGFDAEIAHAFAKSKKRGLNSYLKQITNSYSTYKSKKYNIIAEGIEKTEKLFLITIANASQYGNNAAINPDADAADGKFEVCKIMPHSKFLGAILAWQLMNNAIQNSQNYYRFSTTELSVKTEEPCLFHIDGEPFDAASDFSFSILPNSLKIIIP